MSLSHTGLPGATGVSTLGVSICTRWHDVYAQPSGRDDPHYVPEDVLTVVIMPVLNNGELETAYADKNLVLPLAPRRGPA